MNLEAFLGPLRAHSIQHGCEFGGPSRKGETHGGSGPQTLRVGWPQQRLRGAGEIIQGIQPNPEGVNTQAKEYSLIWISNRAKGMDDFSKRAHDCEAAVHEDTMRLAGEAFVGRCRAGVRQP